MFCVGREGCFGGCFGDQGGVLGEKAGMLRREYREGRHSELEWGVMTKDDQSCQSN